MNALSTDARPNTRDMLAVHQVFRDAFGCAAQLVGSVSGDHADRFDVVADYYANVLAFLHAHHEGEDALLWPKLSERAPAQAVLVAAMQSQHEGLLAALTEAEQRLAVWRAEPDIEHGASLAASLATLGVLCAGHFDEEERRILPLAEELCTVAEWGELPKHGMRSFAGDRLWLILGLLREQMPAEAIAAMEREMPPPVLAMWNETGRAQYEQFIARLRG